MRPSNSSDNLKPFNHLKSLIEKNAIKLTPGRSQKPFSRRKPAERTKGSPEERGEDENRLFMEAMADVVPITSNKKETPFKKASISYPSEDPESEILMYLDDLVKNGTDFVVSLTPEYMEGTACHIPNEIARKLHRGDFSIQDHIDLHGYTALEARNAVDDFLKNSILNGLRAVLIIHGRGLSSPGAPVLKNNIIKWLTSGKWRKWVLAYTSARRCDGGTGATYVLLRNRPLSKQLLKRVPMINIKS
jgi:DNA-nicking Smr family endonuclease